jgi:hypothetical protein
LFSFSLFSFSDFLCPTTTTTPTTTTNIPHERRSTPTLHINGSGGEATLTQDQQNTLLVRTLFEFYAPNQVNSVCAMLVINTNALINVFIFQNFNFCISR